MNKYLNLSINQIRQLLNLKIWLNQIWNYMEIEIKKFVFYGHQEEGVQLRLNVF